MSELLLAIQISDRSLEEYAKLVVDCCDNLAPDKRSYKRKIAGMRHSIKTNFITEAIDTSISMLCDLGYFAYEEEDQFIIKTTDNLHYKNSA